MSEVSIENKLSAEEIEYAELPKDIQKENYLSASAGKFTKEELSNLEQSILKGQKITIINDTTIEALLENPIQLSADFDLAELDVFVKNNIIKGDQYKYWGQDTFNQTITYYQQYEGKMLYKNVNGELTFFYTDDYEIVGYRQTILENFEKLTEEENLLQPIKAIEVLYENGELPFGSKITNVELGYYTLVDLTSSQVLTPVWRVVIDGEENLFVNAVEGKIIRLNNKENKMVE